MDFPTDRLGNTLDLVFTECSSSMTITSCTQGILWSDHFVVEMSLSIPKPWLTHQELQYHKTRSIDANLFGRAIDTCSLLDIDDFEELVSKFSGKLQSALDAIAPLKTKVVTQHPPKFWLNDDITQQKWIIRNRECVFKKYRTEPTWLVLKAERCKLHNAVYFPKKNHVSDLVVSCRNDSGKLYELVNWLMGGKSENPLPDKDPESLAEEFADFFLDKITTIHQDFVQYTPYTCEVKCQSCFQQFEPMTEAEVSKIIYNMCSKSCKLDAIPTNLLKQILPDIIGVITKIVNLSLYHWCLLTNLENNSYTPLT